MDVGALRHQISLSGPGTPVPDGDGGYTLTPAALTPATVWASISPATARDLERVAAGTVLSTATHILRMRYHAGVNTQTRITYGTRLFSVTGVSNPDERNIETVVIAVEVVA